MIWAHYILKTVGRGLIVLSLHMVKQDLESRTQ